MLSSARSKSNVCSVERLRRFDTPVNSGLSSSITQHRGEIDTSQAVKA